MIMFHFLPFEMCKVDENDVLDELDYLQFILNYYIFFAIDYVL